MGDRSASRTARLLAAAAWLLGAGFAAGPVQAAGIQVPLFGGPAGARVAAPAAPADRSLRPAYWHVFPADSEPYGRSYPEWLVEWLQYAYTMPDTVDPGEASGKYCMVGQRGPVWLPLNSTGEIRCTIPADRAIVVGVAQISFNAPGLCGQAGPLSARELREQLAPLFDPAVIAISIDGAVVPNVAHRFRIKSPVFSLALPADNIVNQACGGPGSIPAGVYSPAVGDGVFVIVPPLRAGAHVMQVHYENPALGVNQDSTFRVDVVPVLRR